MTSGIVSLTFDCADPLKLATFWNMVTGYEICEGSTPEDNEVELLTPDGHPALLFIRVPEGKSAKNRIHFDIQPREGTRDEEVARLIAGGATLVDDQRRPDGQGWQVLADPEGNEFCVERERGGAA